MSDDLLRVVTFTEALALWREGIRPVRVEAGSSGSRPTAWIYAKSDEVRAAHLAYGVMKRELEYACTQMLARQATRFTVERDLDLSTRE